MLFGSFWLLFDAFLYAFCIFFVNKIGSSTASSLRELAHQAHGNLLASRPATDAPAPRRVGHDDICHDVEGHGGVMHLSSPCSLKLNGL